MRVAKEKIICYAIIDLLLGYLLAGIVLYIFQSNFIYYPSNKNFYSCPEFSESNASSYHGTRFYELVQGEKLLLFYHGNAGSACDRAAIKEELKYLGYSMLFVEYAGYANDHRKLSTNLIFQDVRNVDEYIHLKNYTKLVIIGESVGTCFASYHSRLTMPDKLILISPPTSLKEVAKSKLPIYPYNLLMKENCDNKDELKNYFGKVLIIHGGKDTIVPNKLINDLYGNIPSNEKEIIIIENADHNTLYLFDKTWNSLKDYLRI